MTSCSVYWIHHPDHTDMFSQGYIGVSKRYKRRLWEHLNLSKNTILIKAIKKYGWDNLVKKEILISDFEYCFEIEKKLRPEKNIGWNIAVGGGPPPLMFGNNWNVGKPSWNKGKKFTEEHKKKLSLAKIGKPSWNKGLVGSQTAWNKGVPMAYRENAQFNFEHTCPHCGKVGKGNGMFRHHMDRCKFKEAK